jgi:helicase
VCESESVMSKLGNETVRRNHILGLIATGDATSSDEIIDFIRDTFYGNESELYGIESAVENVVDFLADKGMVERTGSGLMIMPFGKRVSDLYIDPKSAVILKDAVDKMEEDTDVFPILHAVASTPDVLGMYPRKKDEAMLNTLQDDWDGKFLVNITDDEYQYEYFLGDLKTAALIYDWIDEVDEDTITDKFGVGPGDIRSRVDMADWLLYAMSEIAVLYKPEVVKTLRQLLVRVRYGIKKDILDLVTFKGVGRARARILYDNGIRKRKDVLDIDINKLASLPRIGPALAKKMKEQVGAETSREEVFMPEPIEEEEENAEPTVRDKPKQSRLLDF